MGALRTTFSLYIPKWRVPEPRPPEVLVEIEPTTGSQLSDSLLRREIESDQLLKKKPIIAIIEKHDRRENSIIYQPIGDKNEWQTGKVYIPLELTYGSPALLQLTVKWNFSSSGGFISR